MQRSPMKLILLSLTISFVFASAPPRADEIVSQQLLKSTNSWDGTALPAYTTGQPEITILKFTIPPGASLHTHKHSAINAGVVLSGNLTVISEDRQVLRLESGDALVELLDKWHHGRNDGSEPAIILVFYAGIEGQEFTQAKSLVSD